MVPCRRYTAIVGVKSNIGQVGRRGGHIAILLILVTDRREMRTNLIHREPVFQHLNPQLAKLAQGQLVVLCVLFVRVAVIAGQSAI